MRRMPSITYLAAVATFVAALLATPSMGEATAAQKVSESSASSDAAQPRREKRHWVDTWTAMPQLTEPWNLPPEPFTQEGGVLDDSTLRQTVRVSTGGERIRLSFSNEFGGAPLPITEISVALPLDGKSGSAIEPGTSQPVTFAGRPSVTIPIGARYVSDPLDLSLAPGTNVTVTAYLADGQASRSVTSHPGSRTTSHLAAGNHVGAETLPDATSTDHWYFISAVEAWSGRGTTATAVLGDSLTDGRGSTTNGNDRWPDQLFARLQSGPGPTMSRS